MPRLDIPKRFKKDKKRIQKLRISDPGFREIWEDYLEIIHVIKTMQSSKSQTEELYRLRNWLEQEITEALNRRQ